MKNRPMYRRIPVDYASMQDLSIDIKTMPQAFGGYHLLLVITCDQTNFTIAVPVRDRQTQTIAEALIYRVIYLFGPPRQIVCDKATEFTSAIVQAIITMLNCGLKVISPYNHGSSKCVRQIKTISEIIVQHLWDKGQMWPLFATMAANTMNTFASEALSRFLPFQLVFLRDPPDLTSLSFPKKISEQECSMYRTPRDGEIDIMRQKRDTGIQYRHEKKEDVTGFIPKPIA